MVFLSSSCSRHLLCRQPDNPRDKRASCQSDNHQTLLSLPPHWQPHWLQGHEANTVTDADPGPVFTFSSGLMWLSVSWLLVWVNKGNDWCEQTGQRSSYSIRGGKPVVTCVILALWHYVHTYVHICQWDLCKRQTYETTFGIYFAKHLTFMTS